MRKNILLTLVLAPLCLFAQFPSGMGSLSAMASMSSTNSLKNPNGISSLAASQPVALPAPIIDSLYQVGPGDGLHISYVGSIAEEEYDLAVDPEGTLCIPRMGSLNALKTLRELKKDIVTLIRSKTKNVEIITQLTKLKSIQIDVSGSVNFPGSFNLEGAARLFDAVRKSCTNELGAYWLPEHADLRNVEIHRANGAIETIDLRNYLQNGAISSNPSLYSGDRVFVPQRAINVLTSGALVRPQSCEYRKESALELITYCGGLGPNSDSTVRVNRFRKDKSGVETITLRFPDECKAFQLLPEDNLLVGTDPKWKNGITVYLNGRVKNPGVYSLPKNAKLKDFLTIAGGLLEDADSLTAYLQRPSALNNYGSVATRQFINDIDIQAAMTLSLEQGLLVLADSSLLQDGDVVSVPKKCNSVSVVGKVARPGLIPFEPGQEWDYYVSKAGNFDRNAYKYYTRVYKKRHNAWIASKNASTLEPGDIVFVPELPLDYPWNRFKDIVSVTSGILSISATIFILSSK